MKYAKYATFLNDEKKEWYNASIMFIIMDTHRSINTLLIIINKYSKIWCVFYVSEIGQELILRSFGLCNTTKAYTI